MRPGFPPRRFLTRSAVTEVMCAWEGCVDVGSVGQPPREWREGDELADEDVAVPVGVLVAAAHE